VSAGSLTRLERAPAALLALLLLLAPRVGEACSQCLSGRSEATKLAYLLTTVFLSVLPPLVVGGFVWWLVRRARAVEARASTVARPLAMDRPEPLEG
jgi:hypothetical protein